MESLMGVLAFASFVALGAGTGYLIGATVLGALRPRQVARAGARARTATPVPR